MENRSNGRSKQTTNIFINRNTANYKLHYRSLPDGCRCQSLFSVGACGFKDLKSVAPNQNVENILNKIELVKRGAPFSLTEAFKDILSTINSPYRAFSNVYKLITYNTSIQDESIIENDGIQMKVQESTQNKLKYSYKEHESKRLVISNVDDVQLPSRLITKVAQELDTSVAPLTDCRVRHFSSSRISKCLLDRRKLFGRRLKIVFIGDSQVRNLMEQIVENLRKTLKLRIVNPANMNINNDFLNKKVKHDVIVHGSNIRLQLIWSECITIRSNILEKGGPRHLLQSWAEDSTNNGVSTPDLVILDTGLWSLKNSSEINAIGDIITHFKEITPLITNLSKVSRVIWLPNGPVKDWLAKSTIHNTALDLMNQLAWLKLRESGVWFWDTSLIIFLQELEYCRRLYEAKGETPKILCGDFMHASKLIAETRMANMIWNLVCNHFTKDTETLCCSA